MNYSVLEDLKNFVTIEALLLGRDHWVYITHLGFLKTFTQSMVKNNKKETMALINKFIRIKNDCIEFVRSRTEEVDEAGRKPRIELVPRTLIDKSGQYEFTYKFKITEICPNFRGQLLQIMDHDEKNQPVPQFQIMLDKMKLCSRTPQKQKIICDLKVNALHEIKFVIDFDTRKVQGSIDKFTFIQDFQACQTEYKLQLQYGIYGTQGHDAISEIYTMEFKKIKS